MTKNLKRTWLPFREAHDHCEISFCNEGGAAGLSWTRGTVGEVERVVTKEVDALGLVGRFFSAYS